MDGFINIVKYKQSEFDINEGFDLEQLILLKRENIWELCENIY